MQAPLALTLALVQLGLFALCWLGVALLMKAQRPAALLFMAACLCDAATAWLQVTQVGSLRPVAAGLMTLGLGSAALVGAGAEAFVAGQIRHPRAWLGLLALGAAAAWLMQPLASSTAAQALQMGLYQGSFLLMLLLPVVGLQAPIRQEFGRLGWLALLPFAVMGLAVLAFLLHLLLQPQAVVRSYAAREDQGASSLIPLAVISGLFHIAWLGLTVGRQVLRAGRLARIDGLTGLLRRGPFETELADGLALARRLRQPVTLAFLDVDHFKRINDAGGHAAGDRVLAALGAVLQRVLRSTDRCGRWGGEEFVLLLHGIDASQAPATLQRLAREIAQADIAVPPPCAALTVSIGHATCSGSSEATGAELVARADAAMYEAKRRGRNTIVAHAAGLPAALHARPS